MPLLLAGPLIGALISIQPGPNQLHVYPQSAGCTTTVQDCIDNAIAGDIIDVASNTPIVEDLFIRRSLVLRAAPGFSPVIGVENEAHELVFNVLSAQADADQSVTVEGFEFINTTVRANFLASEGHHFRFRNNAMTNTLGDALSRGLQLSAVVPSNFTIQDNTLASPGQVLTLQVSEDGPISARIERNRVTTVTPMFSAGGLILELGTNGQTQVDVVSNLIYGIGGANAFEAGIRVGSFNDGNAQTVLNISHNTVFGMEGNADGIAMNLGDTTSGVVSLFNNSVSDGVDQGYSILTQAANGELSVTLASNHSFANEAEDFLFNGALNTPLGEISLVSDPQFTDPQAANFRLQANSPLIDAATNDAGQGSFSPDAAGLARPSGIASDVGALEFASDPLQLLTSVASFTALTAGVVVSDPYPGPLSGPAEPFVSGQISFDAIAPSTLNFANWVADPIMAGVSGGALPGPTINELALNGKEDLIIRSTAGPVFGMGIEFFDIQGGLSPSTFSLTALMDETPVGEFRLRTPSTPPLDLVGLWSPVPFDTLRITELAVANENEFFGQVYTGQRPATARIFSDGFE